MSDSVPLGSAFRRLWIATGISSVGDGMVLVAFPLLALEFTHNSLTIAGVAVAGRLPAFLIGLPSGAVVDRRNRRRLMVGVEILRLVVLLSFAVTVLAGANGLPAIYATVFVLGGLESVYNSASIASLPAMVPAKLLIPANSRLLTLNVAGQELAGQALGGLALTTAAVLPFAADAGSFAASALLLRRAIPDTPPPPTNTSLLADLREGIRWFRRSPLLRSLAGMIASMAFFQAAVMSILVLYGTENLHLSRTGYGLLLGVASIGNIIGALSAARLHRRLGSGWSLIVAGSAAALAYPVLAITSSRIAAAAALTLEAMSVVFGTVVTRSVRQAVVPLGLQGRVAAAYRIFILGAAPLGALAGGVLAAQVGVRTTFLLSGVTQLLMLILMTPRLLPRLKGSGDISHATGPGLPGSGFGPETPKQATV